MSFRKLVQPARHDETRNNEKKKEDNKGINNDKTIDDDM